MESTQEKIYKTLEQLDQIQRVRDHFDRTVEKLNEATQELINLETQLDKELADVEAIESMSMKMIFHKILGSKEEQLEKERQEYLQVSLKYNSFKKTVELLEYEKQILENKLMDDSLLRKKLERLKSLREKEILGTDPILTRELQRINENLDEHFLYKKALNSSLDAGNRALILLRQIIEHLKKAKQWGDWDMISRDKMSGFFKYGAIDKAKNLSHQAKQALFIFQRELEKIGGLRIETTFHLSHFSRFTDIFFDNLITDWVMQQKIVSVLRNVRSEHDKVRDILHHLKSEMSTTDQKLIELQEQKDIIIIS